MKYTHIYNETHDTPSVSVDSNVTNIIHNHPKTVTHKYLPATKGCVAFFKQLKSTNNDEALAPQLARGIAEDEAALEQHSKCTLV